MSSPVRVPSYRRHISGQAVVTFRGRDFYCGRFGSEESKTRYRALVAEYLATGRAPTSVVPDDDGPTVAELMVLYLTHCDRHYRIPGGKLSNQVLMIRLAFKVLRRLYSDLPALEFGPLKLKTVRAEFISQGLSRSEVNRRVGLIKQFFAWAVSEELIPAVNIEALRTVRGLEAGRCEAKETEPIRPVSDSDVEKTLPHLAPVLQTMVQFQRLTGARPQEVIGIRTSDIDMSKDTWVYRPSHHKNTWRGQDRVILIGPRSQEILKPWLRPEAPQSPLFAPAERMANLSTERHEARQTPLWPSHVKHQAKKRATKPDRRFGETYSTSSYRRAIHRACDKAGVPRWSPNQLRHSAATQIRKEFGLEMARAVLGHSSSAVTEIYAEFDQARAAEVMGKIG